MKTTKPALPVRTGKSSSSQAVATAAGDTAAKLIESARSEFRRYGYSGTDSNKIARRAGFAPQTFYRWFGDKTEIFLAVYRAWEEDERKVLGGLVTARASGRRMGRAIIAHHRDYLLFRRSLRQLALEDPAVRKARAESRQRQIAQIQNWAGAAAPDGQALAILLLQLERLADAAAEGEFADLGIGDAAAEAAIAALLSRLRGGKG